MVFWLWDLTEHQLSRTFHGECRSCVSLAVKTTSKGLAISCWLSDLLAQYLVVYVDIYVNLNGGVTAYTWFCLCKQCHYSDVCSQSTSMYKYIYSIADAKIAGCKMEKSSASARVDQN